MSVDGPRLSRVPASQPGHLFTDRPSAPTCGQLWRGTPSQSRTDPDPFYCNEVPRRGGMNCMVGLLLSCSNEATCTAPAVPASPVTYAHASAPPGLILHGAVSRARL